jgi:glycosyltransferase involved in cell wall biosynthesis
MKPNKIANATRKQPLTDISRAKKVHEQMTVSNLKSISNERKTRSVSKQTHNLFSRTQQQGERGSNTVSEKSHENANTMNEIGATNSELEKPVAVGLKNGGELLIKQYEQLFDYAWYQGRYADSPMGWENALFQMRAGIRNEGRCPNAYFLTFWYMEENPELKEYEIDPFLHFLSLPNEDVINPHPIVDIKYIRKMYEVHDCANIMKGLIDDKFDYVCEWFSRRYYRQQNQDLTGIKDLENHYLTHGIREGRFPSPNFRIITYEYYINNERTADPIYEFLWEDVQYCVIPHQIPDCVFEQIDDQGIFDPAIYAPGPNAIRGLNIFNSTDIEKRDLIQHSELLCDIGDRPEVIILIPRIGVGGGEKYAAQLAGTLSKNIGLNTLVLVTDSFDDEECSMLSNHSLRGFRNIRIVSFHKYVHKTWKKTTVLALLMMYLRPKFIFNINSDTGAALIEQFGKSLSNFTKLYVTYFSESPRAIGAPFSARYLGASIDVAQVISDNSVCIEKLRFRMPSLYRDRFVLLPQYCEQGNSATKTNLHQIRTKSRFDILWVGRIEQFKRVSLLMQIASRHSDVVVHVFGPDPAYQIVQYSDNLVYHGPCNSLDDINFNDYDGFLFTSKFEGMPNIVLECALKRLPILCADVGGLRETFSDKDIFFYENADDDEMVLAKIFEIIEQIRKLSPVKLANRVDAASAAVVLRHSKRGFIHNLKYLLKGEAN